MHPSTTYFATPEKVKDYTNKSEGYNGKFLIDKIPNHLKTGSSILELGMGPGKDLQLLADLGYQVSGSDVSHEFVDRYRQQHPDSDVFVLNLLNIDISKQFDALYSNKVMIYFDESDLTRSFEMQHNVLNDGGFVFHSFWKGEEKYSFGGMDFYYYNTEMLTSTFEQWFDVVHEETYTEMDPDDSLFLVLKKKEP
eukprot:TRINITY_DN5395_c0_g1_i2.p1 TRINITY_DN5395_c0_g1~~TRINITY_DN5395_c0_g1_i2.p1  ORF type:complete len:195 (+),score=30.08 TRINITY_DN5395_c0_g1_i2:110-694(+)